MLTIYQLKPGFQALLRPLTRRLASLGVTANQVTVAASLLSVAAGTAIYLRPETPAILLLLPAVLLVRMGLNAIDGMLAREHDMKSRLGAVLNELGDVVSDTALYLPLAAIPGVSPALVVAVVLLAVLTEFVGVVSIQIGGTRRYDGPMGKSDRAFVLGAIGLALGCGAPVGAWLTWVLAAVLLLEVVTVVNRTNRSLREGDETQRESSR